MCLSDHTCSVKKATACESRSVGPTSRHIDLRKFEIKCSHAYFICSRELLCVIVKLGITCSHTYFVWYRDFFRVIVIELTNKVCVDTEGTAFLKSIQKNRFYISKIWFFIATGCVCPSTRARWRSRPHALYNFVPILLHGYSDRCHTFFGGGVGIFSSPLQLLHTAFFDRSRFRFHLAKSIGSNADVSFFCSHFTECTGFSGTCSHCRHTARVRTS